jgi:hypothetical protein
MLSSTQARNQSDAHTTHVRKQGAWFQHHGIMATSSPNRMWFRAEAGLGVSELVP